MLVVFPSGFVTVLAKWRINAVHVLVLAADVTAFDVRKSGDQICFSFLFVR